MNNNLKQMLSEVNCIDNFVKEVDNDYIKSVWYTICEDYRFQVNNMPVNENTLDDWLYNSYRKFIYNIPLKNKCDYINFYEKYFNTTWKEIISYPVVKIRTDFERSDSSLYGNRFWDDCFLDKDMKNMYDIRKEYGYDS